MSYQVLARKWRPRRFEDMVGQQHVVKTLVNALDSDRLHHAFLFTGTRGVGKTTIARILAKTLNCEKGVSSKPCGECRSCTEVDEGRFIDLIEVDAASRTKVDETRELLDNVQYAPTRGRYKVYLIDEVHMLSTHSFNALLKTLEEPPPHVKFLLATTDPQKLPVTVLSRCLQFNLMRLPADSIEAQLEKILEAEGIAYEKTALSLLSRSADGSMRDGLSLLDQAIAYGGGEVRETDVREMLGTIDRDLVWRCLQHLASGNAAALLSVVDDVANRGMDYASVLEELLVALHHVAMAQVDNTLISSLPEDEQEQFRTIAISMSPEDTQLFYQTGLVSRRDLSLAPDPRSGLEMSLLRMLAFKPLAPGQVSAAKSNDKVTTTSIGESAREYAAPENKTKSASRPAPGKSAGKPVEAGLPRPESPGTILPQSGEWSEVVNQLGLSGINQQLANNTVRESFADGKLALVLDETFANLHTREREKTLSVALTKLYGEEIKLELRIGKPADETPAQVQLRQNSELQQAAIEAIDSDPNVAALQEQFGARVSPGSIRPKAEAGGK